MEAAIITKHVLQMPAYQDAKSIAIFLSMPSKEISTRDIVLHALEAGKLVFVPYLHAGENPKSKVMDMLHLPRSGRFLFIEIRCLGHSLALRRLG